MFGTYRTLLAPMVVAMHLGGVPSIGSYAVFGFYILSGYLMTFIMQNNYGYNSPGILRYVANRFLRIFPIYWVSILFSVALIVVLGEKFSSDYQRSMVYPRTMSDILKNIFLFFSFRDSPRLSPPTWALTVELFFYILIGIGLSKSKWLVCCWLGLSLLYHAIAVTMEFGWGNIYYSIPAASLPFATGAFIYHFKDEISGAIDAIQGKVDKSFPIIIFCALVGNGLAGYLCGQLKGFFFYTNYLLCAVMVVVLSQRKTLPLITKRFDSWMGDFSYPIYLIHFQVGLVVVFLLSKTGLDYERPHLGVMFASVPLIFITSWLFTVGVERPIERVRDRVKRIHIGMPVEK